MDTNPFNWTLWTYNGVAPKSSAFGALNDFAIDRVNNRFIISQWKSFPLSMHYPVKKFVEDHFAMALLITLFDATFVLSCPLESSSPSDPDLKQCIRSKQRFGLTNGIVTNKAGNMIVVADFINREIAFMTPKKLDNNNHNINDPFTLIGKFSTNYSIDNMEFHSETENEFCFTAGGGQRGIDPGIYLEHDRFTTVPSAVSKICCVKSGGVVQNPSEDCREEILHQTDAKDKKHHVSGASVGLEIESFNWRKNNKNGKILLIGSFFDEGVGVCFV